MQLLKESLGTMNASLDFVLGCNGKELDMLFTDLGFNAAQKVLLMRKVKYNDRPKPTIGDDLMRLLKERLGTMHASMDFVLGCNDKELDLLLTDLGFNAAEKIVLLRVVKEAKT